MAARLLIADGHEVFLHARSRARGNEALLAAPGAAGVLVGDLSSLRQTRELADSVNAQGRFDAVIHNAGVGYREPRTATEDGLEHVFVINVLAPFLLTALVERPDRLIYLSSGMIISPGIRTSLICNGSTDAGTARRLTPTPSCWTRPLRSSSPDDGRRYPPTRWSPAGWRRKWAEPERQTTWRRLR